jgi:uncharacterized protein (TIGR00730 family)
LSITKAYRNARFLTGEDARSVRILCEYLEPLSRLRNEGVHRAIVAFGSARLRRQTTLDEGARDYYSEAADLGERLARWTIATHAPDNRYSLVAGGGPGIMEAFHEGGARVDRKLNLGLGISLPFEPHANPYLDRRRAFEFHYFFMRKFWFMNLAKAFVVFPGGFGTLDELFEVLTLTQTGKAKAMPIVLHGREFWEEVINLPALARRGLIAERDLSLFQIADSVEEAFAAITRALSTPPSSGEGIAARS